MVIQLQFSRQTDMKRFCVVSEMTTAVSMLFARKYTDAERATATTDCGMPTGGTWPPKSRYASAARKAEIVRLPVLNRTFRSGLRFGVNAFTPAEARLTSRATPVP